MVIDTAKMGSWKTSLTGFISAAAGFVAFSPQLFQKYPMVMELAKYIMIGGMASIGILAKDSQVTGGTKLQDGAVPDATLHAEATEVSRVKP
jgi:hypothetical protein